MVGLVVLERIQPVFFEYEISVRFWQCAASYTE